MTWNYRVCKSVIGDEVCFGIYEIYYDEDGGIKYWTESSVAPSGETLIELDSDVRHMMEALAKEVVVLPPQLTAADGMAHSGEYEEDDTKH